MVPPQGNFHFFSEPAKRKLRRWKGLVLSWVRLGASWEGRGASWEARGGGGQRRTKMKIKTEKIPLCGGTIGRHPLWSRCPTVAKALHGQRFPMPLISFINVSYSVSFVVRGQRPRRGR